MNQLLLQLSQQTKQPNEIGSLEQTTFTNNSHDCEQSKHNPVYSHIVKTQDGLSATFELIKILHQYQQSNRWTLLIAPQNLPDKALLDCCSIDMNRVLVVREKQITSVLATIENALSHATCSAVVAWSNNISNSKLNQINQLAEQSQCHFYAFNKHDTAQSCYQNPH